MGIQRKTIYKTGVYSAVACLIFALAAPFLLQFLINLKPVKSRISLEIQKYAGMELRQDKIEFILFPLPGIRFNEIELDISPRFTLAVDRAEVYLDSAELLDRKIIPRQIDIQGPTLQITSGKNIPAVNGKAAPESQTDRTAQSSFEAFFPADMADRIYALVPHSRENIKINITRGGSDYFSGLDARLRISPDKKGIGLTAGIEDIDIRKGQMPELDKATTGILKRFSAGSLHLNLNLSSSGTLSGEINLHRTETSLSGLKESILVPGEIPLKFFLSPESVTAAMGPWQFESPGGEINVEFNYRPPSGETRLMFNGRDVDIAQARALCLPLLGGNEVVDILFDILRGGKTRDVMVGFEARRPAELFDGKNLIIEGSAASARVKIPGVPLIVNQVAGRATMKDGVLHIDAQKGKIQGANIRGGTLDIDLVNHVDEPFSGKFDIDADMAFLPQTLIALLPGTVLARELALVSEIQGSARGVLELNMPTGSDTVEIRVTADNFHAAGRYAPVPLPLSVTGGKFSFTPEKITLNEVTGSIGRTPVQIKQSEFSLSSPFPFKIEQGQADLAAGPLMSWARQYPRVMEIFAPAVNFAGQIKAEKVSIQGPMFIPAKWEYNVKADASNLSIGFRENDFSIQNFSGAFNISNTFFSASRMNGLIQDLTWLDTGRDADLLSGIKLPIQMSRGSYNAQKSGCKFGSLMKMPATGPQVSLTLSGHTPKSLRPAKIIIEDGTRSNAQLLSQASRNKPVINFKGKLDTRTLEKMLVQGSTLHKALHAVTDGRPLVLFTDDSRQMHITAEYMNLDALLSEIKKLKPAAGRQGSGSQVSGRQTDRSLTLQQNLALNSEALIFHDKTFNDVHALIRLDSGSKNIQIHEAGLCGLTASGRVDLTPGKKNTMAASQLVIRSSEAADASRLFTCLLGGKSIIEGRCTFKGELAGSDTVEGIIRHQNGDLSFSAEEGRIYKATLLSRVLSVLNILGDTDIRQQGFGYKSMTVTAEVKESVIHIKKAYIDADDMAIVASGWVDPFNDRLSLTFLVAPFKTIDTIIQHIPLVNTILSGRLVSFPAKASGKLSDPTVIPLHPSAVGKGLITLFSDLIQAPVRLFKGEKSNE